VCNDRPLPSPADLACRLPHADQPRLVRNVTLRILCHFPKLLSVVLGKSPPGVSDRYPFTIKYLVTFAFLASSSITAPCSTPSP